jgi:hexosaminidase
MTNMQRTFLSYVFLLCGSLAVLSLSAQEGVGVLMPTPRQCRPDGRRLPITSTFTIAVTGHPDNRLYAEVNRFLQRLSRRTGIFFDKLGYIRPADTASSATLVIHANRPGKLALYEDETYHLEIDDSRIHLRAPTDIGAIRGLETLFQLISADSTGYYWPGASIDDGPRFAWRGLLLDVALHFQPVDEILRTLDGMAAVKLNVLHLHCCNDQGFRVESKVFPRLQQTASDGQYYTQQDIRTIIRYAAQRGIRVVPEFVVPAHTTAILTAYPELASIKRPYTLQRYFGVFDPVLDPTNEAVYTFLDKLFTEMAALFPDAYFHIGGDENTGKDWQSSPHIRAFMQAHGMKHYMDLQTYFNTRIEPILRRNGKTMIGWDEIFQPGIPHSVVIQSWRGNADYYRSIRDGYRAILSYGYYIDLIQPASYHYSIDPAPDSARLTTAERARVLGGEATMWGELISPETVDSRIWPRTAAIAERLWSPATVKDTDDMYRRLSIVSLELEGLGLRHETNRLAMMRQLANGWDTHALQVLVDVIEPLKIYDRNQGDTMYTVFSPLSKLADVAIPDQPLPRHFNRQVDNFLAHPNPAREDSIVLQLDLWAKNDSAFRLLLAHSPVLTEAAPLSTNLSELAATGLQAMDLINNHHKAGPDWLRKQTIILQNAGRQSGRCELQVVAAIGKLIDKAAQP